MILEMILVFLAAVMIAAIIMAIVAIIIATVEVIEDWLKKKKEKRWMESSEDQICVMPEVHYPVKIVD